MICFYIESTDLEHIPNAVAGCSSEAFVEWRVPAHHHQRRGQEDAQEAGGGMGGGAPDSATRAPGF